MTGRSKPFSGKKKKQQLQEKRKQKSSQATTQLELPKYAPVAARQNKLTSDWIPRNTQKGPQLKASINPKYSEPTTGVEESSCLVNVLEFYDATSIDIPIRPEWSNMMTKEELDASERQYFDNWLANVYSTCPSENLGFFEHNLEVWRQFWRVGEISDVIIVVLDVRFPTLHYPLSLHRYLTSLNIPFILVLMKCDLVDPELADAWSKIIKEVMGSVDIIKVSVYNLKSERKSVPRYADSTGILDLLHACKEAVACRHSAEWAKILGHGGSVGDIEIDDPMVSKELVTIGMIGHPNVGKSSLINSLIGHKVVSASKTPGHTKHFQTIHLSRHIRLCDCPGLIFPVSIPRDLQILNGLFNVAQLSDPFSSLLAASRLVDLPISLGLTSDPGMTWSVFMICELFASKKGFYTSKAGRPDVFRAANLVLRSILDGRILIAWRPKGYIGAVCRHSADSLSSTEVSSDESLIEDDDHVDNTLNRFMALQDEQ